MFKNNYYFCNGIIYCGLWVLYVWVCRGIEKISTNMKTLRILLKVFFAASFVLSPSFCSAQLSLSEAISKVPTTVIPFDATKSRGFIRDYSFGVINPNNIIPDRLYDNVQLTQYSNASDSPDLSGISFRKFAVPNTTNSLLVVSFGGATDWRTDVMCVVNSSGQVLSTLEVTVNVMDVFVKQFRITAQNQIIVTTIKPTSTTSIPFNNFTSFSGYRQDITYSINTQGQFVQGSVQTFPTQTYSRSTLADRSVELWSM